MPGHKEKKKRTWKGRRKRQTYIDTWRQDAITRKRNYSPKKDYFIYEIFYTNLMVTAPPHTKLEQRHETWTRGNRKTS